MNDRTALALAATRRLRDGVAARGLSRGDQGAFAADLDRIERALRGEPRYGDPYAIAQATPADLQRDLAGGGNPPRGANPPAPPAAPAAPPKRGAIATLSELGTTVDAIDFPGFVAGLISGTFQAIVDSTVQQMREYAQLVASLSRSAEDFARDNVSDDQVRGSLAGKHRELRHVANPPGTGAATRLDVIEDAVGTTPPWLADYGLADEPLSAELVEGPLLASGRRAAAEERMQSLATMVLMGINRIVVNEGEVRAKVQFNASTSERTDAQVATAQVGSGIAGRAGMATPQLSVTTVKANTQADANARANLQGEVRVSFRTETFPLERFADGAAIQLINRHARWKGDEPAPAAPAITTTTAPPRGEGGR